ncbi:XdhC family protein [Tetragenococcus halophilus]|uniref:XdhC family protein n=1 Tax=Tetragenococcus halophilus TaxID=51669 RepID=UPI001F3023DA|nr:XdhC family protein [Tetragenococcus halophilus]MCF1600953.1 XdhC family protein [Tetragenococcus halophilus]
MVFQKLLDSINKGQDTVLVTIIESIGSTPRKIGTKMLMSERKHLAGTIGGGIVEYECEEMAKQLIKEQKNARRSFNLRPDDKEGLGAVCGGRMEVLFQYLSGKDPSLKRICQEMISHEKNHQAAWLWFPLNLTSKDSLIFYSDTTGWLGTYDQQAISTKAKRKTDRYEVNSETYLVEELFQEGKVVIFGGGHVSQALVPILNYLDFYCVVVDDRQDYLNDNYFHLANECITADLERIEAFVRINSNDYTVIMTRGHQFDEEILRQLIAIKPFYIGLMGSKHKIAMIRKMMKNEGFATETLNQIYMPIGLEIKAETPAELAISLSAELIGKRAETR